MSAQRLRAFPITANPQHANQTGLWSGLESEFRVGMEVAGAENNVTVEKRKKKKKSHGISGQNPASFKTASMYAGTTSGPCLQGLIDLPG